ncbi:MAG: hypothetical protein HPY83_18270 [Anaerolineae bacterium]|nr:hypothetical protein [Anaerolineae bacterium]NPV09893.1 hypothetical protein [Anaerolineae bacterium]
MSQALRITSPVHGDILNRHDGTATPEGLMATVRGTCVAGADVVVSVEGASAVGRSPERRFEAHATTRGETFEARVLLQGHHNRISARAGGQEASVEVLWDRNSFPRFRFSIDDNILFLKDLAQSSYSSLFDHWYLAFWRGLHERYGAKIHFNIYYQTDESVYANGFFRLTDMPERFKEEWQANSDWMRLTFHAWQNKPDRPYQHATYEQMAHDYDKITEQIVRFAGPELLSTFTTVHWSQAPRDAIRALRDRGVVGLKGTFGGQRNYPRTTRLYLDEAMGAYVGSRDYWWDPEMDLIMVAGDAVLNNFPLDAIVPRLEEVSASPHTSEVIDLMIHEQYFRPELSIYQPDAQEKVVTAVAWVAERGYKPVHYDEGFLGA